MRIAWCALDNLTGHEAGRMLLERMYREETGQELPPILTGEWGKPFFADSPWHFSISHTRNHAFCVLSRVPVGLDAEELDRNINLKLAQKILSPGERAQFDAAKDKRKALLTFWVLKEAAAKLSGKGLQGYPCHTDFSLADPAVTEMEGCLLAVLKDNTQ